MTHVRTLTGDEILEVWGRVLLFPHYAQCLLTIPTLCSVLTYYSRIMLSAYLLFSHYAQCLPIILALCSVLTYYSRIMLNAFWYLLFSKLCQHNPPNPTRKELFIVRKTKRTPRTDITTTDSIEVYCTCKMPGG